MLVTPYPPTPPLGGGRRRQLELLRWLAREADLTFATVVFGEEDEAALTSLVPTGVKLLTGRPVRGVLTPRLPLALQWCWSASLARLIAEEHKACAFDSIVVSHSYGFIYSEDLHGAVRIVDAQNVESRVYRQFADLPPDQRAKIRRLAGRAGLGFLGASRTASKIAALESRVWSTADAIVCVSRKEQELVGEVAGVERTLYIPNCPGDRAASVNGAKRQKPTVSFAGSLDYIPNIHAVVTLCEHIVPRLVSLAPGTRVIVAGRRPSAKLTRFCNDKGVEVIANPGDMRQVVAGSVAACPVRLVAGTRLKILDARNQGLRVVATSEALEGLEVGGDPGVTICDDFDEFARALASLFDAPVAPPPPSWASWEEAWEPLRSVLY